MMKTIIKRMFQWAGLPGLLAAGCLPGQALVIVPTWDSSITSDPNAATIESTINTAIQFYEASFSDPVTVNIYFEEMSTAGLEGHSNWWYYDLSYAQFRAALQSDASTTNDTLALAHLPGGSANPVTGSGYVRVKTANLRALGFTGYTSGLAGGVDGIIGLHTSQMNLSRASIDPNKYDLMATAEHEMDEVLGLCSGLDSSSSDPFPEDLFRYTTSGSRTYTTGGDNAYFSLDGVTDLARFNQNTDGYSGGDYGDWWSSGARAPQVQDAAITPGATPNPKVELTALDVIGYHLVPAPVPVITSITLAGTNLVVHGMNGLASGAYTVLTATNITLPRAQWTPVATNSLNANGAFAFTAVNAVNPRNPRQYYLLELP
jgi:hypothetical protein